MDVGVSGKVLMNPEILAIAVIVLTIFLIIIFNRKKPKIEKKEEIVTEETAVKGDIKEDDRNIIK